jgi:hypothetical protein
MSPKARGLFLPSAGTSGSRSWALLSFPVEPLIFLFFAVSTIGGGWSCGYNFFV